jgi:hypothetical protein
MSKQLTAGPSYGNWRVTEKRALQEQPAFVVLIACPYRLREGVLAMERHRVAMIPT